MAEIRVEQVEPVYHLSLSAKEARLIATLLGQMHNGIQIPMVENLYYTIHDALMDSGQQGVYHGFDVKTPELSILRRLLD